MEIFFNFLRVKGINVFNLEKQINQLSLIELYSLIEECNAIINQKKENLSSDMKYIYTANTELSGGNYPCPNIVCRKQNIDKLAKFAVFFAEKIILANPLQQYNKEIFKTQEYPEYEELIKQEIINDFKILYYMRPLIDSGIIEIKEDKSHFCIDCYSKTVDNGKKFKQKINKIQVLMKKDFFDSITINYKLNTPKAKVVISSKSDIFHNEEELIIENPELIKQIKKIENINKRDKLVKEMVAESNVIDNQFHLWMQNIIFHNWYTNKYNSQYVTNREVDFKVLTSLYNEKNNNINNQALINGISHVVPYIHNIDIEKLVELRNHEKESFLVYRDAVQDVVDLSKKLDSEKQVREALNTFVRPELNKLKFKIKKNKKFLSRSIATDVAISGVFITVGMVTGVLDPQVTALLSLLGINYFRESGQKVVDLLGEPKSIINNKYGFLWKVNEIE